MSTITPEEWAKVVWEKEKYKADQERMDAINKVLDNDNSQIAFSFDWLDTPEGFDYWDRWNDCDVICLSQHDKAKLEALLNLHEEHARKLSNG